MLTQIELLELELALRATRALSVYAPTGTTDPAMRRAWRTELDQALDAVRDAVPADARASRRELDQAILHLRGWLETLGDAPGGLGLAAFATAEGMHHAATVPVALSPLVAWETGVRIAPYIRALARARPVAVALVDDRTARVYAYHDGAVERRGTLRAHVPFERPSHMGGSRQGFGPNTRGRTGTDAAERELATGTSRMLGELAERLAAGAGTNGWIVVGGMPEPAHAAVAALAPHVAARARIARGLTMRSTESEIARAAAGCVAELDEAHALAAVEELLERAGAGGNGTTRVAETLHALAGGAVQELLFTPGFLAAHPEIAEAAVESALEQRAEVGEVSGPAAARLDDVAEGIGARLRFPSHLAPERGTEGTRS